MTSTAGDPQQDQKSMLHSLPGWLQVGIEYLQLAWAWVQAKRTPTMDRWAMVAVVGGSLSFLISLLIRQWADITPYLQDIQIDLLLLAFGALFVALILGGLLWHFVQRALGIGLDWRTSLVVQFASMITKYMPGYGWQYMAKAYLSKRGQGPARRIGLAMMTELGILIMGGLILAGLVAGQWGRQWVVAQYLPSWGWYFSILCTGLIGIVWVKALERLGGMERDQISYLDLAYSLILALVGWVVHVLAVWLIARSLYPIAPAVIPQMLFAVVLSNIVSILVIVVPGGIGIREMTLTLLLADILPLSLGGIVAILLRLTLVVAELTLFGLIMIGQRFGFGGLKVGEKVSPLVDGPK